MTDVVGVMVVVVRLLGLVCLVQLAQRLAVAAVAVGEDDDTLCNVRLAATTSYPS
jgi:hypothetical protein|eukprot:COSAG06_NODE_1496_length_9275_cov_20.266783_10_plen_55_part_00